MEEGWVVLINASKWHYFRKGISLCKKWGYLGSEFELGNDNSPDNCSSCRKKIQEEKETQIKP